MDIRIKPNKSLEAKIRDYMALHSVSAPRAVRAMLGDMTALHGHAGQEQQPSMLMDIATPVTLCVYDGLPDDRKAIGRPGTVMTIVKNFIFEMDIGESILVQKFEGKAGRDVTAATVSACINQVYKNGTFSVITRGVPSGQYIIRRNT